MNYIITAPLAGAALAPTQALSRESPSVADALLVDLGRDFMAALSSWEEQQPAYVASCRKVEDAKERLRPQATSYEHLMDMAWDETGHEPINARNDAALDTIDELARDILACKPQGLAGVAIQARAVWWNTAIEMRHAGALFADARDDLVAFFRHLEAFAGGDTQLWAEREPLWEDLPENEQRRARA